MSLSAFADASYLFVYILSSSAMAGVIIVSPYGYVEYSSSTIIHLDCLYRFIHNEVLKHA
jgi:hypothetical protein